MGLNTLLYNFRQNLIDVINNSQLPVGIVYYIARDVFSEIEREYEKSLKDEQQNEDTKE